MKALVLVADLLSQNDWAHVENILGGLAIVVVILAFFWAATRD